jgi:membrane protein
MPETAKNLTKQKLVDWIYANLAKQAADTVWLNVKEVIETPRGGLLSLGLLLTLWTASNGMNASMTALDRCYNVTRPRPFVQQRFIAIVITLACVLIALLVVLLLPVTTFVLDYFQRPETYVPEFAQGTTRAFINICRYSIGVTLVILLVSSIYQFGTSIRRRWTLITPGAIFAVLGVMAMAYGFNWYVQHFGAESYNKTYGALGGVIILLFLLYLYAVVFLIGAEINSEIDYVVLRDRVVQGQDPLPEAHAPGEIERFRRQLEKRGAKFVDVKPRKRRTKQGHAHEGAEAKQEGGHEAKQEGGREAKPDETAEPTP